MPIRQGRQAPEEVDELTSAELAADQNLSILVNTVDLEDMLSEIETNSRDMHWSGSLSGAEAITLLHRALPGAGAVPSIIYGIEAGNRLAPLLSHFLGLSCSDPSRGFGRVIAIALPKLL